MPPSSRSHQGSSRWWHQSFANQLHCLLLLTVLQGWPPDQPLAPVWSLSEWRDRPVRIGIHENIGKKYLKNSTKTKTIQSPPIYMFTSFRGIYTHLGLYRLQHQKMFAYTKNPFIFLFIKKDSSYQWTKQKQKTNLLNPRKIQL